MGGSLVILVRILVAEVLVLQVPVVLLFLLFDLFCSARRRCCSAALTSSSRLGASGGLAVSVNSGTSSGCNCPSAFRAFLKLK